MKLKVVETLTNISRFEAVQNESFAFCSMKVLQNESFAFCRMKKKVTYDAGCEGRIEEHGRFMGPRNNNRVEMKKKKGTNEEKTLLRTLFALFCEEG